MNLKDFQTKPFEFVDTKRFAVRSQPIYAITNFPDDLSECYAVKI